MIPVSNLTVNAYCLGARSAAGRFAAAIHGRIWRESYQLMLACFDASGHESDQPFMVVAGFVSSARDWDEFSEKWMARLRKDGLLYFHAAGFRASKDIFDGWDKQENRRRSLAADLMNLIESHAFRYFVNGVRPTDFRRVFSEEERETFRINAYALCGRACVADLGRWRRGDDLYWKVPIPELVFERGDIGAGKLRDMLVRHNYPEPIFKPGKKPFETALGAIEPFVPLQAADWLAYEAFQLLKNPTEDRDKWRWPMRQFFGLLGVPNFWQRDLLERTKADLDALDKGESSRIVLAASDDGRPYV